MPLTFERIVSEKMWGKRLDHYLIISGIGLSRNQVAKLINEGGVLVNQKKAKPSYRVKPGDQIVAQLPSSVQKPVQIEPEPMDLNIVYEDEEVIVVDKPKGVIVHPARGNTKGTLVQGLLYHCQLPQSPNSKIRPGVIHRLDKDTTGLLVFAKTDSALTFLGRQIEARKINREYLALAWGDFPTNSGTIDAPIGRSTLDRKKMAVTPFSARRAITSYQVLERFGIATYLQLKLLTGRTHQIRVHMLHYGHPIVGDPDYGGRSKSVIKHRNQEPIFKTILSMLARQALHAAKLGFIHPKTKEYLEFTSPLPDDIKQVLEYLSRIGSNLPG
uniref:Pseudouridine synthase n=1 Tax=candidate division WOR-3 bacterium TaxID=2052148 RepID=A0A7C6A829_UNCW3